MAQTRIPRVAVILPTFNRAWCLAEAVESVLSQTYRDFELIVVDDGSSDGTAELLARYEGRLRAIRRENRGVSAARNAGVAASRSPLLAFLDSDDLWLPGKLARQVAFFEAHPEAAICQTGEIWVRNGRRVNPGLRHRKPSGWIFEPSLELCLVSPSAVMVRRSLFEEVGPFDESLPACEDYDLWLRVSLRHPVFLLPEPAVVKRGGHPDQLSRGWGLDRFRVRAIEKILRAGGLAPGQRAAALAVLQRKCRIYAAGCRKRGRVGEAEAYERLAREFA
ncbi:MAG: glycosyltransferase [Desulfobacterales bacterium]